MKQTGRLTAGLTAGLTDTIPFALAPVVSPVRRCAVCQRALKGRQARFCSGACRTADNAAKWKAAPDAVLTWLTDLLLRGVITRTPTLAQLQDAYEVAGAKRWSRLLRAIGLEWRSESRRWVMDKGAT